MADQDAEQLPQIRAYEKSSPAIIYFAISLLPLLVGISLVVGSLMTPAPFKVYLHWIAALAGGTGLAGLTLLGLTLVSVRGQRGWPIAFGLAILGWLGGLMATLNSSAPSPAKILAVMVPPSLAFLTYRIGIYIASGFLLPTDKKGGGRKQVHLFLSDYSYQVYPRLVRFFFYFFYRENRPCYVITDERREEDRIERRVKGNPFTKFATGPGIIISGCNYAVAVSDGLTFKGVKPPGVTFTGFGDQPVRTVDLRPQLRTFTVHALTKDGIEVQVLFFAPFEIDRGGLEPELGKPPPYRPGAAFKAVHQQKMEHSWEEGGNTQQRDWDELPVIVGKRILQDILSRYNFDELYAPYDVGGEPPRVQIAGEFLEKLEQAVRPMGLHVVGGGISNILPAQEEVIKQRVQSWQAEWSRQVMLKLAQSQQDRLRRIEQARAEAQADLIMKLGAQLAELDRPGVQVAPETILSLFLKTLEELALRPTLRRYIPPNTKQDVRSIRQNLEE